MIARVSSIWISNMKVNNIYGFHWGSRIRPIFSTAKTNIKMCKFGWKHIEVFWGFNCSISEIHFLITIKIRANLDPHVPCSFQVQFKIDLNNRIRNCCVYMPTFHENMLIQLWPYFWINPCRIQYLESNSLNVSKSRTRKNQSVPCPRGKWAFNPIIEKRAFN